MMTDVSELSECRIYGTTVTMLRLSRAFCVAPVHFEKRNFVHFISISGHHAIFSYVSLLLFLLMLIIAMSVDIFSDKTYGEAVFYSGFRLASVCLVCIVLIAGVYGSPRRMRRLMFYFTSIEKITIELENKSMLMSQETKLKVMLVANISLIASLIVVKIIINLLEVLWLQKNCIILVIHTLIYIKHIVMCCVVQQLNFITSMLFWSLKSLNKGIELMRNNVKRAGGSTMIDKVHRLTNIHAAIAEVGTQIDEREGGLMFLLLLDHFFGLSVNVYFAVAAYHIEETVAWASIRIAAQIMHCIHLAFNIVLLVEPCHRTHEEISRTQSLISVALCMPPSARDDVSEALLRLYQAMEGIDPFYKPCGVFKVSRNLYSALIGVLSTYIVLYFNYFK